MVVALDYREVFQYANDSMIIHDAVTGEILEANDAACRLFGRSVGELRALSVRALSGGDGQYSQEMAMQYIHQAARTGRLFSYEWVIRRSDCAEITIEGNLKRMKGGARSMVLAISRDISERKQAEESLRERGRYFSELLRNSSDGVALIAGNGVIKYIGESLDGILGVPARAALGKNVFNFLHAENVGALSSALAKARRHSVSSGTFDYRIRHRDGSWRNHEAAFKNLLNDPSFRAVLVNFRDVTVRVRHEEQMREREQQLNHYSRLAIAGETAAALAHEVNQPLFAAVNFFAGCRRRLNAGLGDIAEISAALELAQQELERAGRIIQSVRQFTSNHVTSRQVHSARAVIAGISCFLDIRARQDDVEISFADIEEAFVECDEVLIQQVISNLVVNGIEAVAGQQGGERRVDVTTRLVGSEIEIAVQDSGPAIAYERLEQMKTTFFTSKKDGMGLGLSLCRSILASHGSQLCCTRGNGAGTRFSFKLSVVD